MPAPSNSILYVFWRTLLRLVFATSCRIHILHREESSRPGAWILAGNHISHFDPPLLSHACKRPVDWMAMEELFHNRAFAYLLRRVGAFPVSRGRPDRAALRVAGERLEAARVVGIFPEGGIRDGEASILQGAAPRPGFSLIAAKNRVPVIPCVILGSDRLYNRNQWLPFRRTPIWIAFGRPLEVSGEINSAYRKTLEQELQTELIRLKDEVIAKFSLSPDDLPKPPAERMQSP